jgi:hypothetical protein
MPTKQTSTALAILLLAAAAASCGVGADLQYFDAGPTVPDGYDAPACGEGKKLCGDQCIDLGTDPGHCGACGRACLEGQICRDGACGDTCEPGLVDCDGDCVDLFSDPRHCGVCGNACPEPTHARSTCVGGRCGYECLAGWTDGNGDPADGCEEGCVVANKEELCNGRDDDCNGAVDDTFPCAMGKVFPCTTACGTSGTSTCDESCQVPGWCEPPPEVCNGTDDDCDGETDEDFECTRDVDTRSCGSCGAQTCGAACTWNPCTGEGVCAPSDARPCERCGMQTCSALCQWDACVPGGECSAGETRPCGACGIGVQTCDASCTWGACSGGGECSPGETGSCGNCGTRTCSSSCRWGSCTAEGECSPGASRACGNCSLGTQTCSASCAWGTCSGGGACVPGTTEECQILYCPGTKTCSPACAWSDCDIGPPPPNDRCHQAQYIPAATATYYGTTCGAYNDWEIYGCGGSAASPDVAYWFVLESRSSVVVDTCGTTPRWDTVLHLHRDNCWDNLIECEDRGCFGTDWDRARIPLDGSLTLDPGTYFIIVDGFGLMGNQGPFTLNVTITPL